MKRQSSIQESHLYRYRYHFAVAILVLIAAFMASYQFWSAPSGLSSAEIDAATTSSRLLSQSPLVDGNLLINLPWSIVQSLSLRLFGLSTLAIRLPSVILTILSVALLILFLRKITKPSISMMGGLLAVSSFFAVDLSRSGLPVAMTTLLILLTLLCAYYALNSQRKLAWLLVTAISCALLCYMDGGIYFAIALLAVAILHPRSRLVLRTNRKCTVVAIIAFAIIVAPLVGLSIAGAAGGSSIPLLSLFNIGKPSLSGLRTFALALTGTKPGTLGGLITPLSTIVGTIMAIIGLLYMLRRARPSVRFYLVVATIIMLLILGSCQPSFVALSFVPLLTLQTICLAAITDKWYGLFPNNPYARVFAIMPIAILIGSLCSLDAGRYFSAINYNSDVAYQYDQTLPILDDYLASDDNHNYAYTIIAAPNQVDFYSELSVRNSNVTVIPASDTSDYASAWSESNDDGSRLIILANANVDQPQNSQLVGVGTSWLSRNPVVFRVYQSTEPSVSTESPSS